MPNRLSMDIHNNKGQKSMFRTSTLFLVTLCLFTVSSWAIPYKGSPEEIGLAIMKESKARDQGWGNSTAEMTMILRNKKGDESVREMVIKSLEVIGDGDKGLTVFNEPRDISGTAFLSFSHVMEADEQWLYLPALKRVKRIASQNKSGPFMGSEFAYEDLSSFEVEKYTYRYIGEETIDGQLCYVIESIPADKFSGYSKQMVWLDQAEYRVQKVDYYDRRNSHRKTLILSDYQQYLDKYWRPLTQQMTNHFTGKSTEVRMKNISFDTGLTEADFNRNALKRAR